jgi:hypothetical protein
MRVWFLRVKRLLFLLVLCFGFFFCCKGIDSLLLSHTHSVIYVSALQHLYMMTWHVSLILLFKKRKMLSNNFYFVFGFYHKFNVVRKVSYDIKWFQSLLDRSFREFSKSILMQKREGFNI